MIVIVGYGPVWDYPIDALQTLANALIHADYHGRCGIVIDKYPKRLEVSNPGTLRMSKSVAIAGGTSDARNGKIFNIFSLVRIGERSGMGLSSLYGIWEKEKFTEPSIVESYEPDRTKVMVEFEADESELGVKTSEMTEKKPKVKEKQPVSEGENVVSEGKNVVSEGENVVSEGENVVSEGENVVSEGESLGSEGVKSDFDVLMGAYRNDFRENAWKVLSAIADNPEIDTVRLTQKLGISEVSVWRAIRAMKGVGLLVREGGDKSGKWIVKR